MASLPGARAPHDANSPSALPDIDSLFLEDILACPACGAELSGSSSFETYGICGNCQRHFPLPARERLRLLVDDRTFQETNETLVSLEPLVFRDLLPVADRFEATRSLLRRDEARGERVVDAAERGALSGSGVSEAVLTGNGTIGGHAAVLIVLDHAFLGASIGPVAGEKILLAMEAAAQRRVPLVAICTAGGARSQEGMLGLLQAPRFAAAAAQMHRNGVPFVSVLAHPATGAVWSALADQADIILAEPGARVGLGSRAVDDAESAESLLAGGMIDGIVSRPELKKTLTRLLGVFAGRGAFRPIYGGLPSAPTATDAPRPRAAGWEEAQLTRHPARPGARAYVTRLVSEWVELHGDRTGADAPGVLAGLGRLAGASIAVIALTGDGPADAAAWRKAARVLRLAGHLELPVLVFLDAPAQVADRAPAQTSVALSSLVSLLGVLPVPVVTVITGEAAGAAGAAFAAGDRVLMQEHATAAVVTAERGERPVPGPQAAPRALTAFECQQIGFVDAIIPEPSPAAHADAEQAARLLGDAVAAALVDLGSVGPRRLLDDRARRLRVLGQRGAVAREAARLEVRELQELQRTVARSLGELRERLESLQLPHLNGPDLSHPIWERVVFDTTALASVGKARDELAVRIERAVRMAPWNVGDEADTPTATLPRDDEGEM
jgi:acetyl-CoA carboxylase beta subunit/acetyl-CoA carboxylase alpha subunit